VCLTFRHSVEHSSAIAIDCEYSAVRGGKQTLEFLFRHGLCVCRYYDVDMSCLTTDFEAEQREYLHQTATWTDIHPGNLLGQAALIKSMDLAKISLEEVKAPIKHSFEMLVTRHGPITGLAGFFDCAFKGSENNPTEDAVRASPVSTICSIGW
jgi:hypothetical protein